MAFPSKDQIDYILDALSGTSTDGMTLDDLQERCNLRHGQIVNALKFLAAEEIPPIRRVKHQRRVSHFFSLRISENLRNSNLEARFALSTSLRFSEKL